MLLMNSSACTLILLDVQLYKYPVFLYVRRKNDITSALLFYLRISAAHKLPTRVSYQLLQPASTHVGRIYPRLVGMRVQKGHLYSEDNDLIPLPSDLPDIFLQTTGGTAP